MCIKQGGLAEDVAERMELAERIVEVLTDLDIPVEDIFIDPCVLPVGVNKEFGQHAMETVERVMSKYPGIHTICGLSNVSFGLPVRRHLNQVFLPMMVGAGLDAVICDPLDPASDGEPDCGSEPFRAGSGLSRVHRRAPQWDG